jgi:hypothetical protein
MIAPNKRYPFFRKDMRVRIKVPDLGLPVGSTGTVQSVTSGRIVIVRWDDGQTFGVFEWDLATASAADLRNAGASW